MKTIFKSGYVGIIGSPNVGKSTLLNALLSQKISIVSPRPQTTRSNVLGIVTTDDSQMIFLDTPGFHNAEKIFNLMMLENIDKVIKDSDVLVFVVDSRFPQIVEGESNKLCDKLNNIKKKKILVVNKIDVISKNKIEKLISAYSSLFNIDSIVTISAKNNTGIDLLQKTIESFLPEGPLYYPKEQITTMSERLVASEIIREKVFFHLHEEVPYSIAVTTESFKDLPNIISISAVIYVEKMSQKGIVIGKMGATLKKIGTQARESLELFFGKKIYLELFVKVQKDWTKNKKLIKELGCFE